jgi:cytidylate kinase
MTPKPGEYTPKDKTVVCICGMAGSGKSTVAKRLATHYELKYYSGGDALRAVASEIGYKTNTKGWWETKEGIRFLEERLKNLELDRKVDQKLLKMVEEEGMILDSWAMPWLLKEGFKIWLEASEEARAQRIAERDGLSTKEALRFLMEKESKTKAIYKMLYGFNIGEDFSPFHLILDVDQLNKNEVFQALCLAIDNLVLRKDGVFSSGHR